MTSKTRSNDPIAQSAGNGLLDRRALLSHGAALAGAMGVGAAGTATGAAAEPLAVDPWTLTPGIPVPAYGVPSRFEDKTVRTLTNPKGDPRGSGARTPHHLLNGTITPNGLHMVVARGGIPDIDPDKHKLLIHGRVKQPMTFSLEALHRYPMVSRVSFVECGGNSAPLYSKDPIQANVQALHGLVSCAEWTGVKLSTLFEEVGIDPQAEWFLAESADSVSMHRSIPVRKAMDDAMIALYQNGERINPSQGYPMRLLVPGYEGNMNVKWLRRIKVVDGPIMAQNESVAYTILMENGKAWQFFYPQEVKSFITHPSPGLTMKGPGFYEISGLSWSGKGRIGKVEVSADGGKSWALAALQTPVLSKALTRFRMPWNWDGIAGGSAQPGDRRERQCATEPGRFPGRTRRAQGYAERGRVPDGALQHDLQLGRQRKGGGDQCLRLNTSGTLLSGQTRRHRGRGRAAGLRGCGAGRRRAPSRATDLARRCGRVGHQHRAGRRRLAARQRHARPGRRRLCAKVRRMPRRQGRRQDQRTAGRRSDHRPRTGGQDGRQLLALCHHGVRLHPQGDALDGAEIAHQ